LKSLSNIFTRGRKEGKHQKRLKKKKKADDEVGGQEGFWGARKIWNDPNRQMKEGVTLWGKGGVNWQGGGRKMQKPAENTVANVFRAAGNEGIGSPEVSQVTRKKGRDNSPRKRREPHILPHLKICTKKSIRGE